MGCKDCNNKSLGLGDSIAKAISKVSFNKIQPCEGCKKRKDFLNRIVPYSNSKSKVQMFVDHIKETANDDDAPH